MRTALLYPDSLSPLVARARRLPLTHRQQLWALYRKLRRAVRRRTLLEAAAGHFSLLLEHTSTVPDSYNLVALALKLAHAYSVQELARKGASEREYRALVDETFRLLRLDLRVSLGMRGAREALTWSVEQGPWAQPWLAIADGSFKSAKSAAGFQVYDSSFTLRAEVGLPVQAGDPVEAELLASTLAIQTLLAFNVTQASVLVDAQSVVFALGQQLSSRYRQHCLDLAALAARFQNLRVQHVPRTITHPADRLAAEWSSH